MTKILYHRAEDGMEYLNLNLPEENVSMTNLGRFAVRAAEYLKECYKERYQTLVRFGKLTVKNAGSGKGSLSDDGRIGKSLSK